MKLFYPKEFERIKCNRRRERERKKNIQLQNSIYVYYALNKLGDKKISLLLVFFSRHL
jgi:hypothetical protein